jgi:hypothetical protein
MGYYLLSPEVAGGFGKNTLMDRTHHPPEVTRLHYEFEGWLGDELLESFPCFIVTQSLAQAIADAALSGVEFRHVEVTTSDQFRELYPSQDLPEFVWLGVVGTPGQDDFGLDKTSRLVVSEAALEVLRTRKLENCEITPYSEA